MLMKNTDEHAGVQFHFVAAVSRFFNKCLLRKLSYFAHIQHYIPLCVNWCVLLVDLSRIPASWLVMCDLPDICYSVFFCVFSDTPALEKRR